MKNNKTQSLLWFIKNSLILDFKFWKVSEWSISKKLIFLFKKYCLLFLLQTGIKNFSLGKSHTELFGKKVYYDCRFGLGDYQSILARHQNMINVTGIKDVQIVVDIGANVGFFSMLIRDKFPKVIIYAIEPVRETFQALKNNFHGDDSTVLINEAISNFCGISKIAFDRQNSAASHLVNKNVCNSKKEVVEEVRVKTLDFFIKEHEINFIDILKIDVETFEKHVLKGAKESLKKIHYLFLEITVENNERYTFSELVSLLYSKGFYNYQLRAFRNFLNKGEGKMPIADFLFENIDLQLKTGAKDACED